MKILNKQLIPPGGWYFNCENGSRIDGYEFDNLLKNVFNYLLATGLSTENLKQRIEDQICTRSPNNCQVVPDNPAAVFIHHQAVFQKDEYLENANTLSSKPMELVTAEEANQRANVCVQCPKNSAHAGCPECRSKSDELYTITRQGRKVQRQSDLFMCHASKACCKTLVWLKYPALNFSNAPANCPFKG